MSENTSPSTHIRVSRPGVIAAYLVYAAIVGRTLAWSEWDIRDLLPTYMGLFLAFLALFTVVLWRPRTHPGLMHLYFVVQSIITLASLSLPGHLDYVTGLFVLLSFQAVLVFTGRARWGWVGLFTLLTGGSLVFFKGAEGLAQATIPMVGCIIYPAYVIVNHETETARAQSQTLLGELQETHRQLESYASQAEELAAMQERNRLARELHDSVSQTMFSIILNIRSTQILLEREPARVRPQLEQLQELTSRALSQMRTLISQWRPG